MLTNIVPTAAGQPKESGLVRARQIKRKMGFALNFTAAAPIWPQTIFIKNILAEKLLNNTEEVKACLI